MQYNTVLQKNVVGRIRGELACVLEKGTDLTESDNLFVVALNRVRRAVPDLVVTSSCDS